MKKDMFCTHVKALIFWMTSYTNTACKDTASIMKQISRARLNIIGGMHNVTSKLGTH